MIKISTYIYILKKYVITINGHKTLCINFWACTAFFPKIMYISLRGQE